MKNPPQKFDFVIDGEETDKVYSINSAREHLCFLKSDFRKILSTFSIVPEKRYIAGIWTRCLTATQIDSLKKSIFSRLQHEERVKMMQRIIDDYEAGDNKLL